MSDTCMCENAIFNREVVIKHDIFRNPELLIWNQQKNVHSMASGYLLM